MSLDIIREYLVSLGFDVDKKSFNEANKSFSTLEKVVENFQKSFAENKAIQQFSESMDKAITQVSGKIAAFVATTEGLAFGLAATIAAVGATIGAVITGVTAAFMASMAKADMEIQLFARRMFTTVENARSLKAVMDTMGIRDIDELKDIALNPELREQFMALRQMSAGLGLDENMSQGMKNIRALGYEFQKLGLLMNYFFQQLGGQLGKVLEGPLKDLQGLMAGFNTFAQDNLPNIAHGLAGIAGIAAKLFTIVVKFNALFVKLPFVANAISTAIENFSLMLDILNAVLDLVNRLFDRLGKITNMFGGGYTTREDVYRLEANALESLAHFTQKIYELLSKAWNMASGILRPIKDWVSSKVREATKLKENVTGFADIISGGPVWLGFNLAKLGLEKLNEQITGGGKLSVGGGVKLSPNIERFMANLESRLSDSYDVTSGIAGRSGQSDHPHGNALDIGLAGKSDASIVALMKAVLATPGLKVANLELKTDHYARILRQLDREGVDYRGRVSNQRTKDWTGDHLHVGLQPMEVSINVHGVRDPETVAQIVYEKVKQQARLNIRSQQGSFA